MITKDYEAIGYLIANTPDIADKLGRAIDPETGLDTAFPLYVFGTLDEVQTNMPSISYRRQGMDKTLGIRDGSFIINCYASTEAEATDLAESVNALFRDANGSADGYPLLTESSMLSSVPEADCVNVPVQVRIINISKQ